MSDNLPAIVPPVTLGEFSAFGNITHFENAQRMAKALCTSAMVPETYRGEQNIGSCLIALEISNRIGMNVLAVMQQLYVVHGKPAWSSQFLIACINASKKFTPLRYRMTGAVSADTYGCVAWANDNTGEKLESPEVTVAMAKAEGWYQKNGSKWKTMPELMLRYRAATLFARLYAPEIAMGILTDSEVVDITSEVVHAPATTTTPEFKPAIVTTAPEVVTKKTRTRREQPVQEATQVENPSAPTEPTQTFEQIVDGAPAPVANENLGLLRRTIALANISEPQLVKWFNTVKDAATLEIKTLDDMPAEKVEKCLATIPSNKGITEQIVKVVV